MQFTTLATLLAGSAALAAAAPTPTTLQPFQVEHLEQSGTSVSFHINDPNENISADCSTTLAATAGTVYTCAADNKVAFAFSDDLSQMSVAVTFPQGTLDDSDAYYIANATAATCKSADGKFAEHINLPVESIAGVA